MDTKALLIIFENISIPGEHMALLDKRYNFIKVASSDNSIIENSMLLDESQSRRIKVSLNGSIGAPKFLFELRNFHVYPLLPQYDISVLIYGGAATWMMPQYYIFKELLRSSGRLFIYGDNMEDQKRSFIRLLSDESFDGVRHVFEKNSHLGFETHQEISDVR